MKTARLAIVKHGEYHKVHPHLSNWTYNLRTIFKTIANLKVRAGWRLNDGL